MITASKATHPSRCSICEHTIAKNAAILIARTDAMVRHVCSRPECVSVATARWSDVVRTPMQVNVALLLQPDELDKIAAQLGRNDRVPGGAVADWVEGLVRAALDDILMPHEARHHAQEG